MFFLIKSDLYPITPIIGNNYHCQESRLGGRNSLWQSTPPGGNSTEESINIKRNKRSSKYFQSPCAIPYQRRPLGPLLLSPCRGSNPQPVASQTGWFWSEPRFIEFWVLDDTRVDQFDPGSDQTKPLYRVSQVITLEMKQHEYRSYEEVLDCKDNNEWGQIILWYTRRK